MRIRRKKYISRYDSVLNPGTFNSNTITFAKKLDVIGPKLLDQKNLFDQEYKKSPVGRKNPAGAEFSCTKPKTYYESKIVASFSFEVTSSGIFKWISRNIGLYKEFRRLVLWRNATEEENLKQMYVCQPKYVIPSNYDFFLETTKKVKIDPSLSASVFSNLFEKIFI